MANDIRLPDPGIISELLSIMFPLRCVHCGSAGNWLCQECFGQLLQIEPTCRLCGNPAVAAASSADENTAAGESAGCPECRRRAFPFISARAAFSFEGPARSLVHGLKYSGQRRLATFMAAISAHRLAGLTRLMPEVTLTFVPLHSSKLSSRGYNQAAMYCAALARRLGLPLEDMLSKKHPTVAQNRLDFDQRRNNLSGSFESADSANRRALRRGAAVILVDDVYTTGSTVAECAGILKRDLGVNVYIWTFARTVRGRGGS